MSTALQFFNRCAQVVRCLRLQDALKFVSDLERLDGILFYLHCYRSLQPKRVAIVSHDERLSPEAETRR